MKAMYKCELARAAGVSDQTFRRWLMTHRKELDSMGVGTRAKLLPPNVVRWICREYDIEIGDVS